jgi:hypothetical protein
MAHRSTSYMDRRGALPFLCLVVHRALECPRAGSRRPPHDNEPRNVTTEALTLLRLPAVRVIAIDPHDQDSGETLRMSSVEIVSVEE